MQRQPIVTALNTSTYVPIVLDSPAIKINTDGTPISYYTEDGSSFYIAWDESGLKAALIPDDGVVSIETIRVDETKIAFYAKASTGTPNLVVLIGEKDKQHRR